MRTSPILGVLSKFPALDKGEGNPLVPLLIKCRLGDCILCPEMRLQVTLCETGVFKRKVPGIFLVALVFSGLRWSKLQHTYIYIYTYKCYIFVEVHKFVTCKAAWMWQHNIPCNTKRGSA